MLEIIEPLLEFPFETPFDGTISSAVSGFKPEVLHLSKVEGAPRRPLRLKVRTCDFY